jgi:exodeoxyribonuclease VII large subunit
VEELQNSKARLIDSVKAQLTANYQKEIDTLNEQLKANEGLRVKTVNDLEQVYKEKMEVLHTQLNGNLQLQQEKVSYLTSRSMPIRRRCRVWKIRPERTGHW